MRTRKKWQVITRPGSLVLIKQRTLKNVVGRLTKRRCQAITDYCNKHTWKGQALVWKFDKGNIIITLTQFF